MPGRLTVEESSSTIFLPAVMNRKSTPLPTTLATVEREKEEETSLVRAAIRFGFPGPVFGLFPGGSVRDRYLR